ncbi:MAG: hypothetical protein V1851_01565 [Patescibacteria group bacterium]
MFVRKNKIKICLGLFLVFLALNTQAFVSSSSNYRLQSDSVNTGGILSTSPNYRMEDTVGELATGDSAGTDYKIFAGYQQMQESNLSVSAPSDVVMPGLTLTQNTSVASTTWNVITDNAAGYSTTVYTEVSALCGDRDGQGALDSLCDTNTGESFGDYSLTKSLWDVSNDYKFGWSAYGNDVSGFGPDTSCTHPIGNLVPSGGLLWQGFDASTTFEIASSTTRTTLAGVDTTMCLATEQDNILAPSGDYGVVVVITVFTL